MSGIKSTIGFKAKDGVHCYKKNSPAEKRLKSPEPCKYKTVLSPKSLPRRNLSPKNKSPSSRFKSPGSKKSKSPGSKKSKSPGSKKSKSPGSKKSKSPASKKSKSPGSKKSKSPSSRFKRPSSGKRNTTSWIYDIDSIPHKTGLLGPTIDYSKVKVIEWHNGRYKLKRSARK